MVRSIYLRIFYAKWKKQPEKAQLLQQFKLFSNSFIDHCCIDFCNQQICYWKRILLAIQQICVSIKFRFPVGLDFSRHKVKTELKCCATKSTDGEMSCPRNSTVQNSHSVHKIKLDSYQAMPHSDNTGRTRGMYTYDARSCIFRSIGLIAIPIRKVIPFLWFETFTVWVYF